MINFLQGGAAKIKSKEFSEFGSRTILSGKTHKSILYDVNSTGVFNYLDDFSFFIYTPLTKIWKPLGKFHTV